MNSTMYPALNIPAIGPWASLRTLVAVRAMVPVAMAMESGSATIATVSPATASLRSADRP
jgi:hypothetical protein